jgi:hypothetical protein
MGIANLVTSDVKGSEFILPVNSYNMWSILSNSTVTVVSTVMKINHINDP